MQKRQGPQGATPLYPMRINKYLAHKGYATRREADALVSAGKVTINGTKAQLGSKVSEHDVVVVDSKDAKHDFLYLAYHKPRHIITHSPQGDEQSIEEVVNAPQRVFPVGRLDKDSEGLIILTNDGRITERLLAPNQNHEKEYEVTVDKTISKEALAKMSRGVRIEGYLTKSARTEKMNDKQFRIVITEGKKHQIRRMCSSLGYNVTKLVRVRIMNIELADIPAGSYRTLSEKEKTAFLRDLGLSA